jgi:hypothetical protein
MEEYRITNKEPQNFDVKPLRHSIFLVQYEP